MKQFLVAWFTLLYLACTATWADGYRTAIGLQPDLIPVVVVSGTPFEMGKALGTLMKSEIQAFLPIFIKTAQQESKDLYSDAALDKAWDAVLKHMTPRYVEELKGVADGADIPFDLIRRGHMIPVVGNYSCSGVAVWGKATKKDHLFQIRNLDYSIDAKMQDYPMVAIYIPKDGIPHMNVSFAGVIGVNTGMNAAGIALTEIGDSPESDEPYNLDGAHFMSLFRDILYDTHNLDEAVKMVQDTKRIKKYHYVIGDGKNKKAVKIRAFAPDLDIWSDNDPKDELAPNILKDIVYHAEGRDPVAYAFLKTHSGDFTADAMIQLSKSIGTLGGNLLNVVYDATTLEAWISYANGEDECAYRRPYVHINMNDYLPFSVNPKKIKVETAYPSRP